MKKKIIIGLSIFAFIFVIGGLFVIVGIQDATSTLDNLIKLHQVEIVREHLLIQIKKVQADLYLKNTRHARGMESLTTNVRNMTSMIETCFKCHHSEAITTGLVGLRNDIETYKDALSRVVTMRANSRRMIAEEDAAFRIGENLLKEVHEIINFSRFRLQEKTRTSLKKIGQTKIVLFILLPFGPVLAAGLAFFFVKGFTRPVNELLNATRHLKSGDLTYRIEGLKDEFGEVAASFNDMSQSLNDQMHQMQRAEQMTIVGEMAASITHELKNPLTGIKIALQMLLENKNLSQSEEEIANASFMQIKRMESLIKEILDFARPKDPEYRLSNINDVVEKTVSFIRAVSSQSLKNGSVTIEQSLAGDIPEIMVDPMQLQQAVMNIVLNAYDAMPDGGTLGIGTSIYDSSVLITISDSGTGMDDKKLEKLFKPFFTTKAKGTGLGMSITKGIVERHGGHIQVESKVGKGTTFTIALPERSVIGSEDQPPPEEK